VTIKAQLSTSASQQIQKVLVLLNAVDAETRKEIHVELGKLASDFNDLQSAIRSIRQETTPSARTPAMKAAFALLPEGHVE
jgi:hypothetical protein